VIPQRPSIKRSSRYLSLKLGSERGTNAIGFDNAHFMTVDPKEERGKRAGIHNAQSICLPRFKWQRRILVEPDMKSNGRGVRP